MDILRSAFSQVTIDKLGSFAGSVLFAIVLWFAGRWLIRIAVGLIQIHMRRRKLDETVVRWFGSSIDVIATVALIVSLLGYFGLNTTSFAALFAGAGVAIGAAWAGLLSHFAAGVFLLVFRPFKVGDVIQAGGVTGTVREIGLFGTTIDDPDNVRITVGNSKLFNDNITNYSANDWRMANARVEIDAEHDQDAVMKLMLDEAERLSGVLKSPAPTASVVDLKAGPVIAVRVACRPDDHARVQSALNRALKIALEKHKIHAPVPVVRNI
jgi:small conductance mechanosensitive channel